MNQRNQPAQPDPLFDLLKEAAAGAPSAPSAARIAAESRRRARQRLLRRAAAMSALAAALMLLVVGRAAWTPVAPAVQAPVAPLASATPTPPGTPAAPPRTLASADDLAWRTRLIEAHITAHEQAQRRRVAEQALAAAPPVVDPQAELRQAVDETARMLVEAADDLYLEQNLAQPAAQAYARVAARFPSSVWASVARARLSGTEMQGVNQ